MQMSLTDADAGGVCVCVCTHHDGDHTQKGASWKPREAVREESQRQRAGRNNASADGQESEPRPGACCFQDPQLGAHWRWEGAVAPGQDGHQGWDTPVRASMPWQKRKTPPASLLLVD